MLARIFILLQSIDWTKVINIIKGFVITKQSREQVLPIDLRHEKDQFVQSEIIIFKDFITINRFSRPGRTRKGVKGIEVHYVASKGKSARNTRTWFELRKGGKYGFGSTHYCIDLDGAIFQYIPENEIAYSSGSKTGYLPGIVEKLSRVPYNNTLSIECCHIEDDGTMTKETIKGLKIVLVHLLKKYNLTKYYFVFVLINEILFCFVAI